MITKLLYYKTKVKIKNFCTPSPTPLIKNEQLYFVTYQEAFYTNTTTDEIIHINPGMLLYTYEQANHVYIKI